ncbi:MAG TPA: hypothetical protein VFA33_27745 [Bryobacteraceae bacterium]|nr:hypothetical protein [Bryobacteraceae bacterium]
MNFGISAARALLPVLLGGALAASADDLCTRLAARSGGRQQTAAGQAANAAPAPRPLLVVKSGAPISVEWSVVNADKPGAIRDVTLHCFLAPESTAGQRETPKLGPDTVYESALTMDFEAKGRGAADFVLQAPAPGVYLLRVETIGAAKDHGHEHYAAMDVKVE